jgi:C-terminal peptidase prc
VDRQQITSKTVEYENQPTHQGNQVGYIRLENFVYDAGHKDIYAAIQKAEQEGVTSLVLDLRGNGGGLLTEAIADVSEFVRGGSPVVTQQMFEQVDLYGRPQPRAIHHYALGDDQMKDAQIGRTSLPLVLLVNDLSASASEITAGALQDNGRAYLVGQRTYGKATVQDLVNFDFYSGQILDPRDNSSGVKIGRTVARFLVPNRDSQFWAIHPEVVRYMKPNPTPDDMVEEHESDSPNAIPADGPDWTDPRPQASQALRKCVDDQAVAEKADYDAKMAVDGAADYQLISALYAAECVTGLKLPITYGTPVDFDRVKGVRVDDSTVEEDWNPPQDQGDDGADDQGQSVPW